MAIAPKLKLITNATLRKARTNSISKMALDYTFKSTLWIYPGNAAWHFITVPKQYSNEINSITKDIARGFGSVKVKVRISDVIWNTSVFPDKNSGCYILPIKKEIRKNCSLLAGDEVEVSISVL